MSRYQAHNFEIPEETIEVAQAAFPKGNVYLTLRDKLGPLFKDEAFGALFAWHRRQEKYGHHYFEIRFAPTDCRPCPCRPDCTQSKRGGRVLSLRPPAEYETLKRARDRQETDAFKTKYKKRAGIEGAF